MGENAKEGEKERQKERKREKEKKVMHRSDQWFLLCVKRGTLFGR